MAENHQETYGVKSTKKKVQVVISSDNKKKHAQLEKCSLGGPKAAWGQKNTQLETSAAAKNKKDACGWATSTQKRSEHVYYHQGLTNMIHPGTEGAKNGPGSD